MEVKIQPVNTRTFEEFASVENLLWNKEWEHNLRPNDETVTMWRYCEQMKPSMQKYSCSHTHKKINLHN